MNGMSHFKAKDLCYLKHSGCNKKNLVDDYLKRLVALFFSCNAGLFDKLSYWVKLFSISHEICLLGCYWVQKSDRYDCGDITFVMSFEGKT